MEKRIVLPGNHTKFTLSWRKGLATNIMSAGSTPERAAYQSASLTPNHAPIYQHSDDAGDTVITLVTPHPNGPEIPLASPGSAGWGFQLETVACLNFPIWSQATMPTIAAPRIESVSDQVLAGIVVAVMPCTA